MKKVCREIGEIGFKERLFGREIFNFQREIL